MRTAAHWRTAAYCRLSREDGDRAESDSIANQRKILANYIDDHPELSLAGYYTDDGYTGTNFDRPEFKRLIDDILAGEIDCILVKDLSRFGRDYIDAGMYLEKWLPEHGVRFIAINDGIDSERSAYDMMMPLKNLFNAQYAKDISTKVKSAFAAKQRRGEFIGAFASYGYLKDPKDHNHLVIDPTAAEVVRRIFNLFEGGMGKVAIAKLLNSQKVPCPSEYKRMLGCNYRNSNRLETTTYWTYSTVHRMLQNEMYIGNMEQSRSVRTQMHGKAKAKDKSLWIRVEDTHEAIISREQWNRVQRILNSNARSIDFNQDFSPFVGVLKCADCGRAMVKTRSNGRISYSCGSYKRYGGSVCTAHYIRHDVLEKIILEDLNKVIASLENLKALAERSAAELKQTEIRPADTNKMESALARVRRLKQSSYEDYKDGLISKADFLRYREDYEGQEKALEMQIEGIEQAKQKGELLEQQWVKELLSRGALSSLDRETVAETISQIRIFEDRHIEISYTFSQEYEALLNPPKEREQE